MIKGGYKIVNFNGAALSGSSETLPGIYAQIVDDYDKPIMVSGVSLNGDIMDDAYAGVQEKIAGDLSKSVELTVYGGIITVTEDDEVTFVLSKTIAELTAEIGDLEDLDTTEKGSVVGAINSLISSNINPAVTISEDNTYYTCQTDGYLVIYSGSSTNDYYRIDIYDQSHSDSKRIVNMVRNSNGYIYYSVYVKKGLDIHFVDKNEGNNAGNAKFYPTM